MLRTRSPDFERSMVIIMKRENSLDFLRVICSICIIAIHVSGYWVNRYTDAFMDQGGGNAQYGYTYAADLPLLCSNPFCDTMFYAFFGSLYYWKSEECGGI